MLISIFDTYCDSFEKSAKSANKKLQNREDDLTRDISVLMNTARTLEDTWETASSAVLLDMKLDVERRQREHTSRFTGYNYEHFTDVFYVEGNVERSLLHSLFGKMIQNDPHNVETFEQGNFVHGLSMDILTIAPVSEDLCWIYGSNSHLSELFDANGDKKGEYDIRGPCAELVVLENGDHVLTCYLEKCIKKVDKNGQQLVLFNTAPLMPVGISLSLEENFLITAEDGNSYNIDESSRRIVQHVTKDGNVKATYEFDGDGRKLFTRPTRVRQNYNGDLCVIDIVNSTGLGRVCVLSSFGYVKFIYRGHSTNQIFCPTDILCDRTCNIIISDLTDSRLYLLSPNGTFIKFLSTEGLRNPQALGLYKSSLWIGCSQGQISISKYKYTK